jgi:hypothetical protein
LRQSASDRFFASSMHRKRADCAAGSSSIVRDCGADDAAWRVGKHTHFGSGWQGSNTQRRPKYVCQIWQTYSDLADLLFVLGCRRLPGAICRGAGPQAATALSHSVDDALALFARAGPAKGGDLVKPGGQDHDPMRRPAEGDFNVWGVNETNSTRYVMRAAAGRNGTGGGDRLIVLSVQALRQTNPQRRGQRGWSWLASVWSARRTWT